MQRLMPKAELEELDFMREQLTLTYAPIFPARFGVGNDRSKFYCHRVQHCQKTCATLSASCAMHCQFPQTSLWKQCIIR